MLLNKLRGHIIRRPKSSNCQISLRFKNLLLFIFTLEALNDPSLTFPLEVRNIFWGRMSLCIILAFWRYSRAKSTWRSHWATCYSGKKVFFFFICLRIWNSRSPSSQNSSTRYVWFLSTIKSWNSTMFGCLIVLITSV